MPHLRHFSAGKIWSVSVVVEKLSVRSYSAVEQSFGYGMGKVYVQGKLSPTSSTDSKLALDLLQLILLEKTRMGAIAHVNLPLIGPQMPNDILRLEAVFNLPNLLTAQLRPHLDQTCIDNRIDRRWKMAALRPALRQ